MLWLAFALLTALFESLKDSMIKGRAQAIPAHVVAWALTFCSLPFLLGYLLLAGWTLPAGPFYMAALLNAGLNLVALSLYAQAIKTSDLSITVPMIAFSPLFLLISSPLLLGEFPSGGGLLGMVLIVGGTYTLHIGQRRHGWLAPYRALLRERGPQLMLAVALLWGVAAAIDKIGVLHSSPVLWVFTVNGLIAFLLTPFVAATPGIGGVLRRSPLTLLGLGFFNASGLICQMTGLTLTLVAYVIAVKRTSIVLSVLLGALLFGERGLRERLPGVLLMLAGVLLIALA